MYIERLKTLLEWLLMLCPSCQLLYITAGRELVSLQWYWIRTLVIRCLLCRGAMSSVMIKCVIDNMFSMFIVKILIVNGATNYSSLLKWLKYVLLNNAISITINCLAYYPIQLGNMATFHNLNIYWAVSKQVLCCRAMYLTHQ